MKSYREALADFKRDYFKQVFSEAKWSATKAAELSRLNRTAIYKVMRRVGIQKR
jgi:DNA-binding NtrC family response regulator